MKKSWLYCTLSVIQGRRRQMQLQVEVFSVKNWQTGKINKQKIRWFSKRQSQSKIQKNPKTWSRAKSKTRIAIHRYQGLASSGRYREHYMTKWMWKCRPYIQCGSDYVQECVIKKQVTVNMRRSMGVGKRSLWRPCLNAMVCSGNVSFLVWCWPESKRNKTL